MPTNTTEGRDSQAALVKSIKSNSEVALSQLYTMGYPKVEQYILQNKGSVEDAKDIFQEAFLAAWRNVMLDRFSSQQEGSISAYLFTIAKNKWIDVLRQRKKIPVSSLDHNAADDLVDEVPPEDQYIDAVKQKFEQMGSPCKELLKLFYFQKQSLRKIAEHFSWTEPTAKNNKYRCLQKLRAAVVNPLNNLS